MIALAYCQALARELRADQVALAWRGARELKLIASAPTRLGQTGLTRRRALLLAMDEACDQQILLSSLNPAGAANIVVAQRALASALRDPSPLVISLPLPRRQASAGALCLCLRGAAAAAAIARHDELTGMLERLAATLAQPLALAELSRSPWSRRMRERWQASSANERRRRTLTAAAAAILAIVLATPLPHTLASDASIQGAVERQVSSPAGGTLAEVMVRPGDAVRTGDTLASLTDRDLLLERDRLAAELSEHRAQADAAMARGDRAELAVARSRLEQSHAELARLDARLEESRVRSPIDGVVLDGDLWQSVGTPVERGQALFTIAPAGSFRATIDLEEAERNRVSVGQQGQLRLQALDGHPLEFRITRIAPTTQVRKDGIVFEAQAELLDPPTNLRAGMHGIAQLEIGRASLLGRWTERAFVVLRESWWRWQP
ncbi:MAG: HlyD family efflux transporter periplasmic adaptor subunit [Burkholderiaceae bacterium]